MEEKWTKLEEIVRRVVREEMQTALKKTKKRIEFENGRWAIGETEMQLFREAYPAVDIDKELREAAVWIVTHPTEAPRSNYAAFLQRWFKTNQDRASLRSIPLPERKTEIGKKLCSYCDIIASGQVGGIWACNAHWDKAMSRDPIPRMRGVEAKPVAGA